MTIADFIASKQQGQEADQSQSMLDKWETSTLNLPKRKEAPKKTGSWWGHDPQAINEFIEENRGQTHGGAEAGAQLTTALVTMPVTGLAALSAMAPELADARTPHISGPIGVAEALKMAQDTFKDEKALEQHVNLDFDERLELAGKTLQTWGEKLSYTPRTKEGQKVATENPLIPVMEKLHQWGDVAAKYWAEDPNYQAMWASAPEALLILAPFVKGRVMKGIKNYKNTRMFNNLSSESKAAMASIVDELTKHVNPKTKKPFTFEEAVDVALKSAKEYEKSLKANKVKDKPTPDEHKAAMDAAGEVIDTVTENTKKVEPSVDYKSLTDVAELERILDELGKAGRGREAVLVQDRLNELKNIKKPEPKPEVKPRPEPEPPKAVVQESADTYAVNELPAWDGKKLTETAYEYQKRLFPKEAELKPGDITFDQLDTPAVLGSTVGKVTIEKVGKGKMYRVFHDDAVISKAVPLKMAKFIKAELESMRKVKWVLSDDTVTFEPPSKVGRETQLPYKLQKAYANARRKAREQGLRPLPGQKEMTTGFGVGEGFISGRQVAKVKQLGSKYKKRFSDRTSEANKIYRMQDADDGAIVAQDGGYVIKAGGETLGAKTKSGVFASEAKARQAAKRNGITVPEKIKLNKTQAKAVEKVNLDQVAGGVKNLYDRDVWSDIRSFVNEVAVEVAASRKGAQLKPAKLQADIAKAAKKKWLNVKREQQGMSVPRREAIYREQHGLGKAVEALDKVVGESAEGRPLTILDIIDPDNQPVPVRMKGTPTYEIVKRGEKKYVVKMGDKTLTDPIPQKLAQHVVDTLMEGKKIKEGKAPGKIKTLSKGEIAKLNAQRQKAAARVQKLEAETKAKLSKAETKAKLSKKEQAKDLNAKRKRLHDGIGKLYTKWREKHIDIDGRPTVIDGELHFEVHIGTEDIGSTARNVVLAVKDAAKLAKKEKVKLLVFPSGDMVPKRMARMGLKPNVKENPLAVSVDPQVVLDRLGKIKPKARSKKNVSKPERKKTPVQKTKEAITKVEKEAKTVSETPEKALRKKYPIEEHADGTYTVKGDPYQKKYKTRKGVENYRDAHAPRWERKSQQLDAESAAFKKAMGYEPGGKPNRWTLEKKKRGKGWRLVKEGENTRYYKSKKRALEWEKKLNRVEPPKPPVGAKPKGKKTPVEEKPKVILRKKRAKELAEAAKAAKKGPGVTLYSGLPLHLVKARLLDPWAQAWTAVVNGLGKTFGKKAQAFLLDHPKALTAVHKFVGDKVTPARYRAIKRQMDIAEQKAKTQIENLSNRIKLIDKTFETSKRKLDIKKASALDKRAKQVAGGGLSELEAQWKPVRKVHEVYKALEEDLKARGLLDDHQFHQLSRKERAKVINRVREYEADIKANVEKLSKIPEEYRTGTEARKLLHDISVKANKRIDDLTRLQIHYKNSGRRYYTLVKRQADDTMSVLHRFNMARLNRKYALQRDNWNVNLNKDGTVTITRKGNPMKGKTYKELADSVRKGVENEAADIHKYDAYNKIAKKKEWTANGEKKGFKKLPEDENIMGPLAGKHVRHDIYQDLMQTYRALNDFQRWYNNAFAHWKMGKTVYSPRTQVRNIMSNWILADVLGDLPLTHVKWHASGAKAIWNIHKYKNGKLKFKDLSKLEKEIMNETTITKSTFTNEELFRAKEWLKFDEWGEGSLPWIENLGKKAQTVKDMPPKLYNGVEESMKSAIYLYHRSRGKSIRAAEAKAIHALFDYSKVPPVVRWARMGYSPFATFMYKATPRLASTLATKPWKAAKYWLLMRTSQQLTRSYMGETPEEFEKDYRVMPEYMQRDAFFGMPTHVRMPWKDKYGRNKYLDVSFMLPWGEAGEMHHKLKFIPRIILPNNPLLNFWADASSGMDTFLDKPLQFEYEDAGEVFWKWMKHGISDAMPGIVDPNQIKKIHQALKGYKDLRGQKKYSLGEAIADYLFGLKFRNVEYVNAISFKKYGLDKERKSLRKEYDRRYKEIMVNKGSDYYTPEEMEDEKNDLDKWYFDELEDVKDKLYHMIGRDNEKKYYTGD